MLVGLKKLVSLRYEFVTGVVNPWICINNFKAYLVVNLHYFFWNLGGINYP